MKKLLVRIILFSSAGLLPLHAQFRYIYSIKNDSPNDVEFWDNDTGEGLSFIEEGDGNTWQTGSHYYSGRNVVHPGKIVFMSGYRITYHNQKNDMGFFIITNQFDSKKNKSIGLVRHQLREYYYVPIWDEPHTIRIWRCKAVPGGFEYIDQYDSDVGVDKRKNIIFDLTVDKDGQISLGPGRAL